MKNLIRESTYCFANRNTKRFFSIEIGSYFNFSYSSILNADESSDQEAKLSFSFFLNFT